MTTKEFVLGLKDLAKKHEKDNVSVFETNWSRVCTEAAEIITKLNDTLKDTEHILAEREETIKQWQDWYADTIKKEVREDLNIISKPETKVFTLEEWDGIRRDFEEDALDFKEGEEE